MALQHHQTSTVETANRKGCSDGLGWRDVTKRTIGWGVVATGNIAHTVTGDLTRLEDSQVVAVSSRSKDRAQAFADEFGIAKAYDSFTALMDDDAVDVVYVATPHPQHVPVVEAAAEAGKAVLCEKAFTTSLLDTQALVDFVSGRGVFCMEAMWTRFAPLVVKTRELVAAGAIGEVRSVRADLGFIAPQDSTHRLWDPALGGGAVLDVGIYPVAFAQMLLGSPDAVHAVGSLSPQGVDAEAGMLLTWEDGRRAQLECSLISPSPGGAIVVGTMGRIEVLPRFHHPTTIIHVDAPTRGVETPTTYQKESEGRGYVPMLRAVAEAVRNGDTERAEMPLRDTIAVMTVLQEVLDQLGVRYPEPAPTGA